MGTIEVSVCSTAMLGLLLLLLLCMAVHSQDHVLDAGGGVVVHVCAGPSCVAPYAVLVHGRAWLVAPPTAGASFLGEPLTPRLKKVARSHLPLRDWVEERTTRRVTVRAANGTVLVERRQYRVERRRAG